MRNEHATSIRSAASIFSLLIRHYIRLNRVSNDMSDLVPNMRYSQYNVITASGLTHQAVGPGSEYQGHSEHGFDSTPLTSRPVEAFFAGNKWVVHMKIYQRTGFGLAVTNSRQI